MTTITDKERLDFLDSLMRRERKLCGVTVSLQTFMHIHEYGILILAMSGIGRGIDFDGIGEDIRTAIDDAMDSSDKFNKL